MDTNITTTTENMEFVCNDCNFKCTKKGDWKRHINTVKHEKQIKMIQDKINNQPEPEYKCETCNRSYSSRVGLWSHKKRCSVKEVVVEKNTDKDLMVMLVDEHNKMKQMISDIYVRLDAIKNTKK